MVQKRRYETLVPKPQNKQTKQRDKQKTGKSGRKWRYERSELAGALSPVNHTGL